MNRRELLWTGAAALLAGAPARAAARRPRSLVVVYAHGGWDPTYTFDPKYGSGLISGPQDDPSDPYDPDDVEELASWGGLRVAINPVKRPAVGQFFSRWSDRVLAVNGLWVGGVAHLPNTRRVLGGTTDPDRPDAVGILAGLADPSLPFGAVDLSGYCRPGPFGSDLGRLGRGWQLGDLLDPAGGAFGPGPRHAPDADERVRAHLRARAGRLAATGEAPAWLEGWERAALRRDALLSRADELRGLLAGRSPGASLDNLLLAGDLVAEGFCRAVMVDSQLYFDTHGDNDDQHALADDLFRGLDALAARLDAAGALDDTLVLVTSEMIRSPVRNNQNGKHHWPGVSALLLGGGVEGRRTIGATDDLLAPVPMHLRGGELAPNRGEIGRYDHLVAGVLRWLRVDPEPWLPGVTPLGGFGRA